MINVIIFSKGNRGAQLDLLFESMIKYAKGFDVFTLIKSTGKDFCLDVKAAVVTGIEHTVFFVDDMVFTDYVDINNIPFLDDMICFSLRLGKKITYDLPLSKNIKCDFLNSNSKYLYWNLNDNKNQGYWSYPMSLDGHIFKTKDIAPIINSLEFNNPNELETLLSRNIINKKTMASFSNPKMINLVLNKVQTTHNQNKSGMFSVEYLQERFDLGHRLDLDKTVNSVKRANSCHVIPNKLYWKE